MNEHTFQTLEFYKVKEELASYTVSGLGRKIVDALMPSVDERAVAQRIQETTEMRAILDASGHIPLHGLSDIRETMERSIRGVVLEPATLLEVADFLRGCRRIKQFMGKHLERAPMVASYASSITTYEELEELIELSIENSRVSNRASHRLAKIRSQIEIMQNRIREKVNTYLTSSKYQDCLQEFIVSLKDGRYCIPVKAAARQRIDGTVIASSGSGQTVFMEPAAVRNLTNELAILKSAEEAEEYQVLSALTGEVAVRSVTIQINIETMASYDLAAAKAKLSRTMGAVPAVLEKKPCMVIRKGRHPLLGRNAVPLDFFIGQDYRTLLITGPNTGGKTVALKTIGLLALMNQVGLHLPAEPGTSMGIFDQVLVDIGDRQSIEQSLSTFSGHMKNVIEILNTAGRRTLVLLDEIGTGTDPAEGAALGAAVLEDLYEAGALTVATTHYGDLKRFSEQHEGFLNGCMAFDPETLQPLYRLILGKAGRSNGIWIAERLGMRASTLARAKAMVEDEESFAGSIDPAMVKTPEMPVVDIPKAEVKIVDVEGMKESEPEERPYRLGDSVHIASLEENGILCELPDARGDVTVIVKEKRLRINQKRIKLHIPAEQLYPDLENYELDIVLLSKEDRKLKKAMNKHHVAGKERVLRTKE